MTEFAISEYMDVYGDAEQCYQFFQNRVDQLRTAWY